MSLQTALFLVERNGSKYRVPGADIKAKLTSGDGLLVQRNDQRHQLVYDGTVDKVQDTDLLVVWESDQTKHITGATFKALMVI